MLDWLTPHDYGPKQSDTLSQRLPGTGQWFLESEEFREWLEDDRQTLFCPGIPGAGKTVLVSTIIEHISKRFSRTPGISIAYLYCEFTRGEEQSIENLLASVLKQLATTCSPLPEGLVALYDEYAKKKVRLSLEEITTNLRSVASSFKKVFIVIDALDECKSMSCRNAFLKELFGLQKNSAVNILATSREDPRIERQFLSDKSVQIQATYEDVRLYLEARLGEMPEIIWENIDLWYKIVEGILKASEGM